MQTKKHSLLEAVVNVAIGAVVALITQLVVFPLYDLEVNFGANLEIMAIFTAVSVCRSYCVRRLFNARQVRRMWTDCYNFKRDEDGLYTLCPLCKSDCTPQTANFTAAND